MVKYLAILKASRRLITICIRSHIIIYVKCNEDNISDLDREKKSIVVKNKTTEGIGYKDVK